MWHYYEISSITTTTTSTTTTTISSLIKIDCKNNVNKKLKSSNSAVDSNPASSDLRVEEPRVQALAQPRVAVVAYLDSLPRPTLKTPSRFWFMFSLILVGKSFLFLNCIEINHQFLFVYVN